MRFWCESTKKYKFCIESGNLLELWDYRFWKNSLINIMLRTLDFDNGEILIDDVSIKKFDSKN